MPQDIALELGSFSISANVDKNFVMTITSCASLSLPDDYIGPSTGYQLRDEVKAGELWVTRAGSCHFNLAVSFEGLCSFALQEDGRNRVITAFESSPIWRALGLDLRCENSFRELPGSDTVRSYSIQHLQQAHGLVSPAHVPCAHLSALSCKLSFGNGNGAKPLESNPNCARIVPLRVSSRKPLDQLPQQTRTRPMLSRKAKEAKVAEPRPTDLSSQTKREMLTSLTRSGIASLFGLKDGIQGINVSNRRQCVGPHEIAPSVWNSRYLQGIVSRTQLAPFISSALGTITNTHASQLSRMLHGLRPDPTEELHKRTVVLVLQSKSTQHKVKLAGKSSVTQSQIVNETVSPDNSIRPPQSQQGETDDSIGSHRHGALIHDEYPEFDDMVTSMDNNNDIDDDNIPSFSERLTSGGLEHDLENDAGTDSIPVDGSYSDELAYLEAVRQEAELDLLLACQEPSSEPLEPDESEFRDPFCTTDNHKIAMSLGSWPTLPFTGPECLLREESNHPADVSSQDLAPPEDYHDIPIESNVYDSHQVDMMYEDFEEDRGCENEIYHYDQYGEANCMDEDDIYFEEDAIVEWQHDIMQGHDEGGIDEIEWEQAALYGNDDMSEEAAEHRMWDDEEAGYESFPAGHDPFHHWRYTP